MEKLSIDEWRYYDNLEKIYIKEVLVRVWIISSTLNNSFIMRNLNWVPSICIINKTA